MSLLYRVIKNPIYFMYKFFVGPFVTRKYINKLENENVDGVLLERLINILEYAVSNVPRYKDICLNYSLSPEDNLMLFPLLKRVDLQIDKASGLSNVFVPSIETNTSGSTGDPLYFYRSGVAGAIDTAHQIYSLKKMGFKRGDRVICFNGFEPTSKMVACNIYWKRKAIVGEGGFGSIQFSTNRLSKDNVKYYLSKINEIKPTIIKGYPSAIYAFFKLIDDNDLKFNIKAIHLTSENIYEHQVELIERKANSIVYKQYGHTECAMFAETDADSNVYKFSPFYGYIEVLNVDGKHVEVGQFGEITVTGFNCYKESFIRYQTGDFARYLGIVDGMQSVDSMMGREQDYFISIDGDSIPITSIISGSHLSINKHVTKWQIRQTEIGVLKILTLNDDNIPEECFLEIEKLFEFYSGVCFEKVDVISLSKSGKFKFFISDL